jgi:AraC family transcriptional regulator
MNPLENMNQAMAYLEANLLDEIDFAQMAKLAGCSEYHFRRVFSYLAGISLGEYLRCRKLSLAGDLLKQGTKVIDTAMLLGYDSSDAFAKAFRGMHGVSPSQAKQLDVVLQVFPPMTFQLTIKGGNKMEYRIVHNPAFQIVGFKKRITLQHTGENPQMASLYQNLTPERIKELKSISDVQPQGILSVSANFSEREVEGTELDQYVGVATTEHIAGDYDVLPVEASDWAVFTVVGPFPEAVQETWARIYGEWLAQSSYQLTGGPELLWHESPDLTQPDCKSELWIPVSKM